MWRGYYIFILDWIPSFTGLGKDNCKKRRETFRFWDLVRLVLEVLRYFITLPRWVKIHVLSFQNRDLFREDETIHNTVICPLYAFLYWLYQIFHLNQPLDCPAACRLISFEQGLKPMREVFIYLGIRDRSYDVRKYIKNVSWHNPSIVTYGR